MQPMVFTLPCFRRFTVLIALLRTWSVLVLRRDDAVRIRHDSNHLSTLQRTQRPHDVIGDVTGSPHVATQTLQHPASRSRSTRPRRSPDRRFGLFCFSLHIFMQVFLTS